MDPIVTVLLTTAAGAVVGTSIGVLLMRRQLRPPITEAEAAELKSSLHRSESSLAAAKTTAESLEKQIANQDKTIQETARELKEKQLQLDRESKKAQEEVVRRSAADQTIKELKTEIVNLAEQCTKLDLTTREQTDQLAEKATQVSSLQVELDSSKRQAQEVGEQAIRLTAQLVELRSSMEQEVRYRSSLELQLRAHQEQTAQVVAKITELQGEREQLEIRLKEERQSAAKGMELLMLAQEKFSGVLKPAAIDGQNGNANGNGNGNGNGTVKSPQVDADIPEKLAVAAQSHG